MRRASINRYQTAACVLPVLAIAAVSVMGTQLYHASHAMSSGDVSVTPGISTDAVLPDSARTACCELKVQSATSTTNTSQRVNVVVTVHNLTNTGEQISPGLQFNLIDAHGFSHPYTAQYLRPGDTIGGPLAPQATTTLNLDFVLAPGETARYLQFQLDARSQQLYVGLPL